jgi:hypothetical protein
MDLFSCTNKMFYSNNINTIGDLFTNPKFRDIIEIFWLDNVKVDDDPLDNLEDYLSSRYPNYKLGVFPNTNNGIIVILEDNILIAVHQDIKTIFKKRKGY